MATNDQVLAMLTAITQRLASIESKLSSGASAGHAAVGAAAGEETSRQTTEWDGLIAKFGGAFSELSTKLGADAAALVRA